MFDRTDLEFVLQQILMAEAGQPPVNPHLAFGLREVAGTNNNTVPGQSTFGSADQVFPRATDPVFQTVTVNVDGTIFDPNPGVDGDTITTYRARSIRRQRPALVTQSSIRAAHDQQPDRRPERRTIRQRWPAQKLPAAATSVVGQPAYLDRPVQWRATRHRRRRGRQPVHHQRHAGRRPVGAVQSAGSRSSASSSTTASIW